MAAPNNSVTLIARAPILPYSMVYVPNGYGAFSVLPTPTAPIDPITGTVIPIGVTDGSVSDPNGVYHALAGEPVTLQRASVVLLRAGNTIEVKPVEYSTDGVAWQNLPPFVISTTFRFAFYQALEKAFVGQLFQAIRIGSAVRRPGQSA